MELTYQSTPWLTTIRVWNETNIELPCITEPVQLYESNQCNSPIEPDHKIHRMSYELCSDFITTIPPPLRPQTTELTNHEFHTRHT